VTPVVPPPRDDTGDARLAGLLARDFAYSGSPSRDPTGSQWVLLDPFRRPSQRRGRPGFTPGSLFAPHGLVADRWPARYESTKVLTETTASMCARSQSFAAHDGTRRPCPSWEARPVSAVLMLPVPRSPVALEVVRRSSTAGRRWLSYNEGSSPGSSLWLFWRLEGGQALVDLLTREPPPTEHHSRRLHGVLDIRERIPRQQQQIRPLADRHGPAFL
jgi:hypothetical protein